MNKRPLSTGDGTFERNTRAKQSEPSKVLHVRGLPMYTTEVELMGLCSQFAQVTQVLIMSQKSQAFVELASVAAAQSVLSGFEITPPTIRNTPVYFQFSSRQFLEVKPGHTNPTTQVGAPQQGSAEDPNSSSGTVGSVLLLNITQATVPVTLENIHQVCTPYGQVNKIIIFSKGQHLNALVEMGDPTQAASARQFLDGKDMFQGCCHLQVNISQRAGLVVRQNSMKSWDYTGGAQAQRPNFPSGGGMLQSPMHLTNPQDLLALTPGMVPDVGSPVCIVSQITTGSETAHLPIIQQLFNLFGVYGDVVRIKILFNKRDTALVQFTTSQQAALAVANLNHVPFNAGTLLVALSKHTQVQPTQDGKDADGNVLQMEFNNSAMHRYKNKRFMNLKNVNSPSQVLMIANVDPSVPQEELAALFASTQQDPSVPPQVEYFKSSKQLAYVYMPSVAEGVRALIQFHMYQLGRYPIRVSFSPRDPNRQGSQGGQGGQHMGGQRQQMQPFQMQHMGMPQMGMPMMGMQNQMAMGQMHMMPGQLM